MATSTQIDIAASTQKPPVGKHLDDAAILAMPERDLAEEAAIRDRAVRYVERRALNGEDFDGLLDALGLRPPPAVPLELYEFPSTPSQQRRQAAGVDRRPDLTWQDDAACRGEDLGLFFGEEGERRHDRELREIEAAMVCGDCPVQRQCLDHAISRPEKYGFWAGLNEDERASERRRRMRRANAA